MIDASTLPAVTEDTHKRAFRKADATGVVVDTDRQTQNMGVKQNSIIAEEG